MAGACCVQGKQGAWVVGTEGSMPDADGAQVRKDSTSTLTLKETIEGLCAGHRQAVVCPLTGPVGLF